MNLFKWMVVLLVAMWCCPSHADTFWGITTGGISYGTTGSPPDVGSGVGLLVFPDGTRYEFSDRRVFMTYSDDVHDPVCVRWLDLHEECVEFGETDCDRGVSNFDIDGFVTSLIFQMPDPCGGRIYGGASVDAFVSALVD